MLTTTAKTQIPPPPPDPNLFSPTEVHAVPQDFLVAHTFSDALLFCLNNALPEAVYSASYLAIKGQRLSWNALHNFLEELVTYNETYIGMPGHSQRVARLALRCGVALGLDLEALSQLYWGAALHDIGKLALDQCVLAKASSLTQAEWRHVQQHPNWGHEVIKQVLRNDVVAKIALTHHEYWNGGGYPRGLVGTDIPLFGRVVAIADTFDAVTSKRSYKNAVAKGTAIEVIRREAGRHLDPELVELFLDGDVLFRSDLELEPPDVG